jgi:hypothetical protein
MASDSTAPSPAPAAWREGDECLARWSDGNHYYAIIESIRTADDSNVRERAASR